MSGPAAYLFWHRPVPSVGAQTYETTLAAFHRALAADAPPGFSSSWTWRLDTPPWFPGDGPTYLDVYLVVDLVALGHLEQAAVSGSRRASHDAAATAAAEGAGGLSQIVAGTGRPERIASLSFLDKPAGCPATASPTVWPNRAPPCGCAAWCSVRDRSTWSPRRQPGRGSRHGRDRSRSSSSADPLGG